MPGIMLRHRTARAPQDSGLPLQVPILSKPFSADSLKECPGCHIVHLCKTVHLMINDEGLVMVSQGVLEDLKSAGMPDLEVVGEVKAPPALHIDGDSKLSPFEQRAKQDQEHRRIIVSR